MTHILDARRGVATDEVRDVTEKENIPLKKLLKSVAKGRTVVVGKGEKASAIGELASTKINANLGTSQDYRGIEKEIEKLNAAIESGADTVMDLSMTDQEDALKALVKESTVPVGTVPVYMALTKLSDVSEEEILKSIEKHIELGADFLTIHSAVLRTGVNYSWKRRLPIVSRGGCFLASWMLRNNKENPLYTNFDYILEMLKGSDVAISIGDALRPGCLSDASDKAQIHELKIQGELVKKAHKMGVSAICEGPGHMPLSHIQKNVRLQKRICSNAPYYVLGPITTDIGAGYDHITSAIGGAIAAMAGADFLCVVTPAEHLGLPTMDDIIDGVVAAKLAAHSADIEKFKSMEHDDELSEARANLDWNRQFSLSVNPRKAREMYEERATKTKACSMCGNYCAIKLMKESKAFLDSSRKKKR